MKLARMAGGRGSGRGEKVRLLEPAEHLLGHQQSDLQNTCIITCK